MNEFLQYANIIKRDVKIDEAARLYGLTFNRAGFAQCPFHAEKTPSFRTHNNKGRCFGGCGWHGDVIAFTRDMFNLDFNGTIRKLNDDFALCLPLDRKPTLREQREAEKKQRELAAIREAERRSKTYDLEQFNRLAHYSDWLRVQEQTEAVKFDAEFIGRLMEQYIDTENHITFDALALVEALLSKHDNADTFKWFWREETQDFPTYEQFYRALYDDLIL